MEDYQTDNDLLNFINKKKHNEMETPPNQVFFLYTKAIRIAIVNTYEQQKLTTLSISCSQLIHNIFWIIYNYSLNTKLTMFMCERAVLLFNEYINISKNYGNETINMIDVHQFIINKTVGPLKISPCSKNKKYQSDILEITKLSQVFEQFIYKLFTKIVEIDKFYYTHNVFLESVSSILSNILYKINKIKLTDRVVQEFDNILDSDILDIPKEVNMLKIKLEIFLHLYKKKCNIDKSMNISNDVINNNIDKLDELYDINEFFDWNQNIVESEFFNKLINEADKYISI